MRYQELKLALAVFELGERATLAEIKERHRELVKLHHPDAGIVGRPDHPGAGNADLSDAGNAEHPDQIRKVNAAYQVLLEYASRDSFSFAEEEFYEQNPEEQLRRQFMDDPLWGNG
jgi:DnaJ-class molecular chaperone